MKKIPILLLVLMMISTVAFAKKKSRSTSPRVTVAYTLTGCSECTKFKRYLRRSGVELDVNEVRDTEVSLFPTVFYSDGNSDHGERVYGGKVRLPKLLKVYECE